jgi:hypothetical protein
MRSFWIAAACALSGCATGVYEPPATLLARNAPVPGGIFDRADFDRDGRLSRDETERMPTRISMHFGSADADQDGYLTYKELRLFMGRHRWETMENSL